MNLRQLLAGRDSSAFDKSKQTVEEFVFEQNRTQSTVNVKIRNFILVISMENLKTREEKLSRLQAHVHLCTYVLVLLKGM